jgi:hypothetical protein
MKYRSKLAILVGALALSAAPALANEPTTTPPDNQGTAHVNQGKSHLPSTTPPASASLPAKAKAYGFYCQGESKKHVDGQKGTPFSQCVTGMAKLANGSADNPRQACVGLSKKHVDGQKGTPYSQCVSGAAKLQHDQDQSDQDQNGEGDQPSS